jgi:hypothetical protein
MPHNKPTPAPPLPPASPPHLALANTTGRNEQRLWHNTINEMEAQPSANIAELQRIRNWITEGITLDFVSLPVVTDHDNTFTVTQHADAVRTRIQEYIDFKAIRRLSPEHPRPFGIQPLHAIIKEGKKPRLVIDLSRNLNDHLQYEYFTYSSVNDAAEQSTPNCWYGKLDLTNCFLSFPLHRDALPHFIFIFEDKYYQFTRMPFGLSTAPRICTLLLSVVAFGLAQAGIDNLVRYLDDFLLIAHTHFALQHRLDTATSLMSAYGLVVNPDKTDGPAQRIAFLGIQLDSVNQTLSCTPERVKELLQLLAQAATSRTINLSSLATLIGKLQFAASVLPGARPFVRRMLDLQQFHHNRLVHRHLPQSEKHFSSIPSAAFPTLSPSPAAVVGSAAQRFSTGIPSAFPTLSHSSGVVVGSACRFSPGIPSAFPTLRPSLGAVVGSARRFSQHYSHRGSIASRRLRYSLLHGTIRQDRGFRRDIHFWQEHLAHWNGTERWRSARTDPWSFASDASLEGFGFYLESTPTHIDTSSLPSGLRVGSGFCGLYSKQDSHLHSATGQMTWCEMFAVYAALHTYRSVLRDSSVLLYVDNKTDVDILNKQATRSNRLAGLLREIYTIALHHNIRIRARHRSGIDNTLADFLSRPTLHGGDDIVHTWQRTHPELSARLSHVSIVFSHQFGNKRVRPSSTSSLTTPSARTLSALTALTPTP